MWDKRDGCPCQKKMLIPIRLIRFGEVFLSDSPPPAHGGDYTMLWLLYLIAPLSSILEHPNPRGLPNPIFQITG
jgi:hypothetical protein